MPADVSELLALAAAYDAAGPRVAAATVEAVSEAADAGLRAAENSAPYRTGDLSGSGQKVLNGAGGAGGAQARIRFTERYAWYVYAGTSKMAPNPTWLDNARDLSERELAARMTSKIGGLFP